MTINPSAATRPQADLVSIQDCGVMLEPQLGMSMETLVKTAQLAEELGFGYVVRSDHILPTNDKRGIDSPECWTSLGVLASATKRVKFGPMVSPIGFRNPALLAKMACTLHSSSHGRLQLAVGAGWYEAEYKAFGYPFPDFKGRLAQFRESLTIITELVRNGRTDFDGQYFTAHTDCYPRPDGDLPIVIGGHPKSIVRLAAKYADEWNYFRASEEQFTGLKSVFEEGRDGRDVIISEMGPYLIGKDMTEVESNAKRQLSALGMTMAPTEMLSRLKARMALVGTPDEFIRQLRQKFDSGVKKVYFQTLVPENTEMLTLLADTIRSGV